MTFRFDGLPMIDRRLETKRDTKIQNLVLDIQHRDDDRLYIHHNAKSVKLIESNAARGMSRKAMEKIWSLRLLNLVLGHEVAK
jgi:hypothetical protein